MGVLAVLTVLASSACGRADDSRRIALIDELQPVMPIRALEAVGQDVWTAFARCPDAELEAILSAFRCHQEHRVDLCVDEDGLPLEGDAFRRCYAELSDVCRADLSEVSNKCLEGFEHAADNTAPDATEARGRGKRYSPSGAQCERAVFGALMAAIAYKPADVHSLLKELDPEFRDVTTYLSTDPSIFGNENGFAYMALLRDECHVAFRGTANTRDLIQNLKAVFPTNCVNMNGQLIGGHLSCAWGFYEQYSQLRELGLTKRLVELLNSGTCTQVLLYGHSLGGALSSLLAGDLTSLGYEVTEEFTYGEPRAWVEEVAKFLQGRVKKGRWVDWGDPIPALPPASLSYYHYGSTSEIYKTWTGRIQFYEEPENFAPSPLWPPNHSLNVYIERLKKGCAL